jgi:DnaK suppressor protein
MDSPIEIRKERGLSERRAVLEAKVAELEVVFRDRSGLAIESSADLLDTIRMATDRDVLVQRLNMSVCTLSDVHEAIAALDSGEYGTCEDCEERISAKRLDAIPWARVCVHCQEARDRRRVDTDIAGSSLAA